MQKLKKEKQIKSLESIDSKLKEVDMIPDTLQLHCVRAALSTDVTAAYQDIKSQNIVLKETFENSVTEYLTSVLSSVQRLPPFDMVSHDGFSYLKIREKEGITYLSDKKISIIPLIDPRIQIIIMPLSSVPKGSSSSMSEIIKATMREIDESKMQKFDEIMLPSFRIETVNQELDKSSCSFQISEGVGGTAMKGGCQSALIELVSGLPPKAALRGSNKCALTINEPFIFALND